jgi:hypothetical protein
VRHVLASGQTSSEPPGLQQRGPRGVADSSCSTPQADCRHRAVARAVVGLEGRACAQIDGGPVPLAAEVQRLCCVSNGRPQGRGCGRSDGPAGVPAWTTSSPTHGGFGRQGGPRALHRTINIMAGCVVRPRAALPVVPSEHLLRVRSSALGLHAQPPPSSLAGAGVTHRSPSGEGSRYATPGCQGRRGWHGAASPPDPLGAGALPSQP